MSIAFKLFDLQCGQGTTWRTVRSCVDISPNSRQPMLIQIVEYNRGRVVAAWR
jgi:hypothetical protein